MKKFYTLSITLAFVGGQAISSGPNIEEKTTDRAQSIKMRKPSSSPLLERIKSGDMNFNKNAKTEGKKPTDLEQQSFIQHKKNFADELFQSAYDSDEEKSSPTTAAIKPKPLMADLLGRKELKQSDDSQSSEEFPYNPERREFFLMVTEIEWPDNSAVNTDSGIKKDGTAK